MDDTIPAIDAARYPPIAVVMLLKRYLQLKHRVQIGVARLKKLHTRVVGLVQDVVRHDVQQRANRIGGIGLRVIHTKNGGHHIGCHILFVFVLIELQRGAERLGQLGRHGCNRGVGVGQCMKWRYVPHRVGDRTVLRRPIGQASLNSEYCGETPEWLNTPIFIGQK